MTCWFDKLKVIYDLIKKIDFDSKIKEKVKLEKLLNELELEVDKSRKAALNLSKNQSLCNNEYDDKLKSVLDENSKLNNEVKKLQGENEELKVWRNIIYRKILISLLKISK